MTKGVPAGKVVCSLWHQWWS